MYGNLKYDANEPIYKAETVSQHKPLVIAKGQGVERVDWEFAVSRSKLLTYRMDGHPAWENYLRVGICNICSRLLILDFITDSPQACLKSEILSATKAFCSMMGLLTIPGLLSMKSAVFNTLLH